MQGVARAGRALVKAAEDPGEGIGSGPLFATSSDPVTGLPEREGWCRPLGDALSKAKDQKLACSYNADRLSPLNERFCGLACAHRGDR